MFYIAPEYSSYLEKWITQIQFKIAFRAKEGKNFHQLGRLFLSKRLIKFALLSVLKNQGSRTAGVDGVSVNDFESMTDIDNLVDELHDEFSNKTYRPLPVKRVFIPKANGKERPLGIPTIRDRAVQQMCKLVMEPIWEGEFYNHSYGFRPFRSTHHAAARFKDLIGRRGYEWVVEGDISNCFEKIDHSVLIRIIRKRIKDGFVIHTLQSFLKAGVLSLDGLSTSESGTPQGGIISPLLANIYLNELDKFVGNLYGNKSETEKVSFNKEQGKMKRKVGELSVKEFEYLELIWTDEVNNKTLAVKLGRTPGTITDVTNKLAKKGYIEKLFNPRRWTTTSAGRKAWHEARKARDERLNMIPCYIVRYADDFVVHAKSYEDAVKLKKLIADFLSEKLSLRLSEEKTSITNAYEGFDFLGFNIRAWKRGQQSTCLIRPSKEKTKKFYKNIKEFSKTAWSNDNKEGMICHLNLLINGWGNYYSKVSSSREFRRLDHLIWHRIFKDTYDIHQGRKFYSYRKHYKENYLPYRMDMVTYHRYHEGKNYGIWANDAATVAYIVTKLSFLKINYVNLHPQGNPFVAEELIKLQTDRKLAKLLYDINKRVPNYKSKYGEQWFLLRQHVRMASSGKCAKCGKDLYSEDFKRWLLEVHHKVPMAVIRSLSKGNKLENLLPYCQECHKAEHLTPVISQYFKFACLVTCWKAGCVERRTSGLGRGKSQR